MGEERGKENEEILRPLMRPDRLGERAERMGPLDKGVRRLNALFVEPGAQGEAGVSKHVFRRIREQGQVGYIIPDVGEPLGTELAFKGCEFPMPGEVCRVVTSKHTFKQPEVTSYSLGQVDICSCGKVELAPARPLLLKEMQQGAVVREMSYVEFNARGDEGLEGSLSFHERGRQSKKGAGMRPSQRKKGIEQCVGFNKGSV